MWQSTPSIYNLPLTFLSHFSLWTEAHIVRNPFWSGKTAVFQAGSSAHRYTHIHTHTHADQHPQCSLPPTLSVTSRSEELWLGVLSHVQCHEQTTQTSHSQDECSEQCLCECSAGFGRYNIRKGGGAGGGSWRGRRRILPLICGIYLWPLLAASYMFFVLLFSQCLSLLIQACHSSTLK